MDEFIKFLSSFIPGVISGIIVGVITGMIIQSIRFKKDLRLDKIRRLMPYMETIHPIFETLINNVDHNVKLLESNDLLEFNRYIDRTAESINSYGKWFELFVAEGMKPELQSLDYKLYAFLYGIFVYYQITKIHGNSFLRQEINSIQRDLKKSKSALENFLRQ